MNSNHNKPVMVEMFSGIGSQAKALKKLNLKYDIHILDWDISAFYAYDIIHHGKHTDELIQNIHLSHNELVEFLASKNLSTNGKHPVSKKYLASWKTDALKRVYIAYNRTNNLGNIKYTEYYNLPDNIEILTYSFPCQDLSIGGAWHGNMTGIDRNANNRSSMLWEVERILEDLKKYNKPLPKFLLMENVYNINSERHKHNFNEWKQKLDELGYCNRDFSLNSINYGIPQSRKRTYMLSVLSKDDNIINYIKNYEFTKHDCPDIMNFLRTDYSIEKYKKEADASNPNKSESRDKIYQDNIIIYDKEPLVQYIKTITTKQDRNPNSGIIEYPEHGEGKSRYRNLTPRECFLFMGFDEDDYDNLIASNFEIQNNKEFYKREKLERLAGNSIVVNVLMEIFTLINNIKIKF